MQMMGVTTVSNEDIVTFVLLTSVLLVSEEATLETVEKG
jgi:hypothetical protein